jgi:predicted transcriptional regulator
MSSASYLQTVANWMRDERGVLAVTQQELAAAVGVSDSTISNWEFALHAMPAEAHAKMVAYFAKRRREMQAMPAKAHAKMVASSARSSRGMQPTPCEVTG